jgi:nucleoside diphosphate kinase
MSEKNTGESSEFSESPTNPQPNNTESCFFIKPDHEKHDMITEDAVKIAVELGLTPFLMGKKKLSYEEAVSFYKGFKDEPWFPSFMEYLTSGVITAYFTEGEGAIEKTLEVKRLVREKHARDRQQDAIHAPKREHTVQETREIIRQIFEKRQAENSEAQDNG